LLRRILKYTPVAVLGLLVVAWVVSWFCAFIVGGVFGQRYVGVLFGDGVLAVSTFVDVNSLMGFSCSASPRLPVLRSLTGNLMIHFDGPAIAHQFVHVEVPIVLLISLGMPLAIGPLVAFRFRLWHFLAYTALLAVELAYYLRWQGSGGGEWLYG